MGLAPMAVLPEQQRRGIGSELVRSGLDRLKDQAYPLVIVLGHPEYSPRFGFERASKYGITGQWAGVPENPRLTAALGAACLAEERQP